MPRQETMLFIEPEQHYLEYSSLVLRDLVGNNRRSSQDITELKGQDANPQNVNDVLEAKDPVYFMGIGHGNDTVYSVECTTVYMRNGDDNAKKLNGRVVHLNSCKTAASLGPNLVSLGARAFFGSKDSFWFYVGSPANSDRASISAFIPELQIDVSMLQGKTTGEAQSDKMIKMEEEMYYWTSGPGKTHPHALELADMIRMNKEISTFLGDPNVRVTSGVGIPGISVSSIMTLTPLLLVGGLIASNELSKGRKKKGWLF